MCIVEDVAVFSRTFQWRIRGEELDIKNVRIPAACAKVGHGWGDRGLLAWILHCLNRRTAQLYRLLLSTRTRTYICLSFPTGARPSFSTSVRWMYRDEDQRRGELCSSSFSSLFFSSRLSLDGVLCSATLSPRVEEICAFLAWKNNGATGHSVEFGTAEGRGCPDSFNNQRRLTYCARLANSLWTSRFAGYLVF